MAPSKPLFATVSRLAVEKEKHHRRSDSYTFFDVLLALFVGFLLTATGMHFMYTSGHSHRLPAHQVVPLEAEDTSVFAKAQEPQMEELNFLKEQSVHAPEDVANKPAPRKAMEVEAPEIVEPPEVAVVKHDVRFNVDITAVENDPVELVNLAAPGAGGNQPCAEGGADILPGWVCVQRNRIERRPTITPEELRNRYYKQGVPVILTDFVVKEWKVFTEDAWAPLKLKERFGNITINIQLGRESDPDFEIHQHLLRRDIKFGDYIDMVLSAGETNDFYITANNHFFGRPEFKSMLEDVRPFFPGFMREQNFGSGTYYWLGPKHTITPLHQDATSLFHVHMKGRKLWRFISPDQKALLYNNYGVYSDVDLLLPWEQLIEKYPLMKKTKIITEIIGPGEVVFVPNGWFHHVIGLDTAVTSMSTTVWLSEFRPLEQFLHKRWNSLYREPTKSPAAERAEQIKGLKSFIDSCVSASDMSDSIKTKISTTLGAFKKAMADTPNSREAFVNARKEMFSILMNDPEQVGGLLYVLAHEKFNHIPDDWRGWVLTNIARHPPLPSILQVMRDGMDAEADVWGVVSSWFTWMKTDQQLFIGH